MVIAQHNNTRMDLGVLCVIQSMDVLGPVLAGYGASRGHTLQRAKGVVGEYLRSDAGRQELMGRLAYAR